MRYVVTGGGGYIGSHLCELLHRSGHEVLAIDKVQPVHRFARNIRLDLLDRNGLVEALTEFRPDGLFHLAGNSAMASSYEAPGSYLSEQLTACLNVLDAMEVSGTSKIVFSSSCSVYGNAVDAEESQALEPISPYAKAKVLIEQVLKFHSDHSGLKVGIFRFFNVIGRNSAAGLTENHTPETHLLPIIIKRLQDGEEMEIHGTCHETPDKSAIRDYVDVRDVAQGLKIGVDYLEKQKAGFFDIWNLGNQIELSVLNIISLVEALSGQKVKTKIINPRLGDPSKVSANSSKARRDLAWTPCYEIQDSIRSLLE